MELHCSQTAMLISETRLLFEYPMELHCSQTDIRVVIILLSLSTLWNYTALKPMVVTNNTFTRLSTLWNYTALKQYNLHSFGYSRLSTLWNYTALKHNEQL